MVFGWKERVLSELRVAEMIVCVVYVYWMMLTDAPSLCCSLKKRVALAGIDQMGSPGGGTE